MERALDQAERLPERDALPREDRSAFRVERVASQHRDIAAVSVHTVAAPIALADGARHDPRGVDLRRAVLPVDTPVAARRDHEAVEVEDLVVDAPW